MYRGYSQHRNRFSPVWTVRAAVSQRGGPASRSRSRQRKSGCVQQDRNSARSVVDICSLIRGGGRSARVAIGPRSCPSAGGRDVARSSNVALAQQVARPGPRRMSRNDFVRRESGGVSTSLAARSRAAEQGRWPLGSGDDCRLCRWQGLFRRGSWLGVMGPFDGPASPALPQLAPFRVVVPVSDPRS